jgi:hypothetical protein
MPITRAAHGCSLVTNNNIDYMIILGGASYYAIRSDIIYFNIVQKKWENSIPLPEQMADIKAIISLQLDSEVCNMMVLYSFPAYKIYICRGSYNWLSVDITGMGEMRGGFTIVGANELLPCGID